MSISSQDPTSTGKLVAVFSSQNRLNEDTFSDGDEFSLRHQLVLGSNEPFIRFPNPANVAKSLLDGNRDHWLAEARSTLTKQEYKVESLNTCISELQQQTCAQRLELEDAYFGYVESRREQDRLQEELIMKEKALRDTQIRSIHEMGEMKRAQELRADKFSVQKLRESRDTTQRLASQIQELQERVNCMNDSGDLQGVEPNYSGNFSHVPSQRAVMQSRGKRLPLDTWNLSEPQGNTFGNPSPMFDSSQTSYQGILHSTNPSATGAVPVQGRTGTPVAGGEERIGSTITMPMSERRPSTMNSFLSEEIPQNSLTGQQRLQISELRFDKFPLYHHFWFGRYDSKIKWLPALIFRRTQCYGSKR